MDADLPYSGRFVDGAHRFAIRVYFEDTDAGGVVYHANYLRFMERARSDMLRVAGIDQRGAIERGQGVYVVSAADIRFRNPARLDDDLVIVSQMHEIRGASLHIHQTVMRNTETMAAADVTVVFTGPEGKPKRQPKEWIAIFEALRGKR